MRALLIGLALAATACRVTPEEACSHYLKALQKQVPRELKCHPDKSADIDVSECADYYSQCAPEAALALNAYASCYESLPVCIPKDESVYQRQVLDCAENPFQRINKACAQVALGDAGFNL